MCLAEALEVVERLVIFDACWVRVGGELCESGNDLRGDEIAVWVVSCFPIVAEDTALSYFPVRKGCGVCHANWTLKTT